MCEGNAESREELTLTGEKEAERKC
jgi:hypothetical protein